MEAKLIKRGENNYKLYVNEVTFATTDNSPYKRLSLKNCQAIELGYDLDVIVENNTNEYVTTNIKIFNDGFEKGFQKAIEILGDKKFNYEKLKQAFQEGMLLPNKFIETYEEHFSFYFPLQETEWDVEIKTQEYLQDVPYPNGEMPIPGIPILDSEGCLILQKIN